MNTLATYSTKRITGEYSNHTHDLSDAHVATEIIAATYITSLTIWICTGTVTVWLGPTATGSGMEVVVSALTWPSMITFDGMRIGSVKITNDAQSGKSITFAYLLETNQ